MAATFEAVSPLEFTLKAGKQSIPLTENVGLFRPAAGTAVRLRPIKKPGLYAEGTVVKWEEKELFLLITRVSGKGTFSGWTITVL